MWFFPVEGEVDNLIRDTLDDQTLMLVWIPGHERRSQTFLSKNDMSQVVPDNFGAMKRIGCFAVMKNVRRAFPCIDPDGRMLMHSTVEPNIVMVFDGTAGWLRPTSAFIDACVETDKCRHGAERDRRADKMRVAAHEKEWAEVDSMAATYAQDDEVRRSMAAVGAERVSTPDRAEMLAMEREEWSIEESRHRLRDIIRHDAQMYAHKKDEELE